MRFGDGDKFTGVIKTHHFDEEKGIIFLYIICTSIMKNYNVEKFYTPLFFILLKKLRGFKLDR